MPASDRRGFTLIELLVVAVILGVLATLAVAKTAATKDKAKLASVKSDLHALQVSQEAHYTTYAAYGTLAQLTSRVRFTLSKGNTATVTATSTGYTGTITNASITKGFKKCQVSVGAGVASTLDGVFVCS